MHFFSPSCHQRKKNAVIRLYIVSRVCVYFMTRTMVCVSHTLTGMTHARFFFGNWFGPGPRASHRYNLTRDRISPVLDCNGINYLFAQVSYITAPNTELEERFIYYVGNRQMTGCVRKMHPVPHNKRVFLLVSASVPGCAQYL